MSESSTVEESQSLLAENDVKGPTGLNGEQVAEEEVKTAVLVKIRFPKPTNPRTLPKPVPPEDFTSLSLLPQLNETVQDLKLAVIESIGGHWIGPFSLRIPEAQQSNGTTGHKETRGKLLGKGKDGVEIREGEKLGDWVEMADAFSHVSGEEARLLDVVREPYSEFTARQTVLRLLELIAPFGTSTHTMTNHLGLQPGSTIFESVRAGTASSLKGVGEPVYEEVEVSLPSGRKGKGGKKEVVKIKREIASEGHAFADWRNWTSLPLGKIPMGQELLPGLICLRSIQLSAFNPPPAHLRSVGHQLYLQVTTLEGEPLTLVCCSRGWYVSKSSGSHFDPAPRINADGATAVPFHSLLDLLHSLSPQFTERLAVLPHLGAVDPIFEPISTVPIPQAESSYPWLATVPKPDATSDIIRTQLAYLHTGAVTADALDGARDWNEDIQGVRELPRGTIPERAMREKMAQKTWAEFTQASIRSVMAVSRGDVHPINPNEDVLTHMWLVSNIFITKAVDSIDAYAHLGGDSAAHVSHSKDAAGVKLLNKLDIDGISLLGHTVVDWNGERFVCQSMLPGIFSRRKEDELLAEQEAQRESEKKNDWVKVPEGSPSKSTPSETDAAEKVEGEEPEQPENPLIIYGLDSEQPTSIHWDAATHKLFEKIAVSQRLAAHQVKDGKGEEKEFYASAEVKGLRGADGRRYLLDLPRLSPVDIEWLEKDMAGKMAGPTNDEIENSSYPHRVVLLRPELVEFFWAGELKRWARGVAAKHAEEADAAKSKGEKEDAPAEESAAPASEEPASENGLPELTEDDKSPAAEAAAATRAEEDKPVDASVLGDINFELRLNPDAFVDQAPAKGSESKDYVPSIITDESDPSIKAVRDASVFLRDVAIPAIALDVLTGVTSSIMDGISLSKHLHTRGVNIRYLGYLAASVHQFSLDSEGVERPARGNLSALKPIVLQEMVFRASKHILRRLVRGLQPEHIPCAVSHFLNCLLGTNVNAEPKAIYEAIDLSPSSNPAYTSMTPESLRQEIISTIQIRYRWNLDEDFLLNGIRRPQLLRELAMRFAFQLVHQTYNFDTQISESVDQVKEKKEKKKGSKAAPAPRKTTFEPADILTMLPVVHSTAPSVTVAEEIFEGGRNTINRGNTELGLDFMLEAITLYENIHSIIHPEVAYCYNQYNSVLHQLARIKLQQSVGNAEEAEQPLGLDINTGLKLQRQAVVIAERTLGVHHPETAGYYFNLAMMENLEGNHEVSLKYFRHLLSIWDVIYGPGHPEISVILSNAGFVLQGMEDTAGSLALFVQAQQLTAELFGPTHIQNGQSLYQLMQCHFINKDIPAAYAAVNEAYEIFENRLGKEHAQTVEVGKNKEILTSFIENAEQHKLAIQQAKLADAEKLKAASLRLGSSSRRRIGVTGTENKPSAVAAGVNGEGSVVAGGAEAGIRPDLPVDDLVKYIQGSTGGGSSSRGKNALRGKRRTGAKR